jgi:hypothetical protein
MRRRGHHQFSLEGFQCCETVHCQPVPVGDDVADGGEGRARGACAYQSRASERGIRVGGGRREGPGVGGVYVVVVPVCEYMLLGMKVLVEHAMG